MFLSLPTQSRTSINESVLRQRLKHAAHCTRANLTHGRAQGPFAPRAHLPPFVRASAFRLGWSVGEKPRELPCMLPGREEATTFRDAANPQEDCQLLLSCCLQSVKYRQSSSAKYPHST